MTLHLQPGTKHVSSSRASTAQMRPACCATLPCFTKARGNTIWRPNAMSKLQPFMREVTEKSIPTQPWLERQWCARSARRAPHSKQWDTRGSATRALRHTRLAPWQCSGRIMPSGETSRYAMHASRRARRQTTVKPSQWCIHHSLAHCCTAWLRSSPSINDSCHPATPGPCSNTICRPSCCVKRFQPIDKRDLPSCQGVDRCLGWVWGPRCWQ